MPDVIPPATPAAAPAAPAPVPPAPVPVDGGATPPADPAPVEDEALGDPGKRALTAEREARKAAEKTASEALARLQAIEDEKLSDLEKAQKAAADASTRLAQIEATSLRQQVALAKGVPAALVGRLQGATEAELSADADALLGLINAPRTPAPDPGQGPRPPAPPSGDAEFERYAAAMKLPSLRK